MRNDVRELRTERAPTRDLAVALKVSRQTVNATETGRYLPSPPGNELARFFGNAGRGAVPGTTRALWGV